MQQILATMTATTMFLLILTQQSLDLDLSDGLY
jgi:hypothetical protein